MTRFGWAVLVAVLFLLGARSMAGCTPTREDPPYYSSSEDGGATDSSTKPSVGTLTLEITTGADSLRLDSVAAASIGYADGNSEIIPLPFYRNADGGSTSQNFTQGSVSTISSDISSTQPITSIELYMVSHPIEGLETNDNWTIQEVRASVSYGGGPSTCVLDHSGATITDGKPLIVSAGGCTSGSGLTLLVVTGGDDLRGDSTASVRVDYQGGGSNDVALTQSFAAGSTVQVDVGLTSMNPISALTFRMQSHPTGFEGPDNWDIRQVEALVGGPDGGMPMCIIDALGKKITDNADLTVTPGGCPDMTADGGADGGDDGGDDASADAASD